MADTTNGNGKRFTGTISLGTVLTIGTVIGSALLSYGLLQGHVDGLAATISGMQQDIRDLRTALNSKADKPYAGTPSALMPQ